MNVTVYHTHVLYRFLAVGCLVMTVVLAWDVIRLRELPTLFFCLVSAALLLWSARAMFSRVEVTADRVALYMPLTGRREVEFRQLVSVSEEGRWARGLLLIYHPRQEPPLLDLDEMRTLPLPAVDNQDALRASLETRTPG
jgi:hypothetical protein